MMGKNALLSVYGTRGPADAGRRKESVRIGPAAGSFHCRGGGVASRRCLPGGAGGISRQLAAFLATNEDVSIALGDKRPPLKLLDLPHCYTRLTLPVSSVR